MFNFIRMFWVAKWIAVVIYTMQFCCKREKKKKKKASPKATTRTPPVAFSPSTTSPLEQPSDVDLRRTSRSPISPRNGKYLDEEQKDKKVEVETLDGVASDWDSIQNKEKKEEKEKEKPKSKTNDWETEDEARNETNLALQLCLGKKTPKTPPKCPDSSISSKKKKVETKETEDHKKTETKVDKKPSTPRLTPREFEYTEQDKKIAAGARAKYSEFPTSEDYISDWDDEKKEKKRDTVGRAAVKKIEK